MQSSTPGRPKFRLYNVIMRVLIGSLLIQAIFVLSAVAYAAYHNQGDNWLRVFMIVSAVEAVVCVGFFLLGRIALKRWLIHPLETLEINAKNILSDSQEQRFADQPVIEFGRLAAHLNEMAERIQLREGELDKKDRELENARQIMEAQVMERTAELRALGFTLQQGGPGQTIYLGLSDQDELTGLMNRSQFMLRLGQTLEPPDLLGERSEKKKIALLFIDLDQFKVVNDSLGHVAGDELLVTVASRLQTRLGSLYQYCRFGGDEFVVLMDDIQAAEDAEALAKNILAWVAEPLVLQGQDVYTSASIGIAVTATGEIDPVSFLRNADTAVYRAKSNGRNRYEIFSERMHLRARRLLKLEAQIRQAIEDAEFRMYFQPIHNSRDRSVAGLEALIRWKHPQQGFLLPQDFIPLAEEAGLIKTIDQWVIQDVCAQVQRWSSNGKYEIPVTVNISGQSILDPETPAFFKEVLTKFNLSALAVDVEISEEAAMQHFEISLQTLSELNKLGISCWMDDFGQAYSSLSHLRYLPVRVIKIPSLFIKEAEENRAILKAIIDMCHALDLRVCAEGIETEHQADLLASLRCDLLQGYLFAPPLPLAGIEEYLHIGHA